MICWLTSRIFDISISLAVEVFFFFFLGWEGKGGCLTVLVNILSVTKVSKTDPVLSLGEYSCYKSVCWVFSRQIFSLSTLCSPAINPNGLLLDEEQEYSSQWILAAESGTTAGVRACGFGLS